MSGKKRETKVVYRDFTIRYRPDRKACWQLAYPKKDGIRKFKHFETLELAKGEVDLKSAELERIGAQSWQLSNKQRADALEAEKILSGKVSLVEAARYYMKHEHPAGEVVTIANLAEQYKAAMIARNAREHSVKGFDWRAKAFCRAHGTDSIHRISRADIESWLNDNNWEGLNRRHYIATVRAMFNFAIEKELLDVNPAAKIELPMVESKEPVIMTPHQISSLLHTAEEKDPAIAPALAISFFAGLRPVELARLNWVDVHLSGTEPVIHVSAEVAKKRHRRNVDISPNLAAWLTVYRKLQGRIMLTMSNHRRHLAKLIAAAGVKLPYNAGRHAFASYAYQIHGLDKTMRWLGHGDGDLLLTTYKGLVTQSEADKFWNIQPKETLAELGQASNINRFKLAVGT